MPALQHLTSEIFGRREEPYLVRAQLRALSKQLPLLYAMLCTNALALAATHIQTAPAVMTIYLPALLCVVCMIRGAVWLRLDVDQLQDAELERRLQTTMKLVGVLGLLFCGWAMVLYHFSNLEGRLHVAFFMSITMIGCIFCLIHLREAALRLAFLVTIPFAFLFGSSGSVVFLAIALNFVIVVAVMTWMALTHYKDFSELNHTSQELKALSRANERAALTDSLTGLSNRRRFFVDLESEIAKCRSDGSCFLLGLLDVDGFKPINDIYGHGSGDQLLAVISARIVEALHGAGAVVARLGGDEFAFIVPGVASAAESEVIGRRICDRIRNPIQLETVCVTIRASIGMSLLPDTAIRAAQLMERADYALYHAKAHAQGSAVSFSREHADNIRERRKVEHALRCADLDAELSVMFQPIVDVSTGRVTAMEALARWNSPVLGRVPPDAFIRTAERIGLIKDVTESLFAKACLTALDWPSNVLLSFNLSTEDLTRENASARLTAMIAKAGLPPERLMFEITETAVMGDYDAASAVLRDLRDLGCRIALDDFGTGFSSLSYVHRLPLDRVKVDKSFVHSLVEEPGTASIIKSVIDLTASLGLQCVAEGVETPMQADLLRAMGCDSMQGYLFAKPLPASSLPDAAGPSWLADDFRACAPAAVDLAA